MDQKRIKKREKGVKCIISVLIINNNKRSVELAPTRPLFERTAARSRGDPRRPPGTVHIIIIIISVLSVYYQRIITASASGD